jgi:hypothetical protein
MANKRTADAAHPRLAQRRGMENEPGTSIDPSTSRQARMESTAIVGAPPVASKSHAFGKGYLDWATNLERRCTGRSGARDYHTGRNRVRSREAAAGESFSRARWPSDGGNG